MRLPERQKIGTPLGGQPAAQLADDALIGVEQAVDLGGCRVGEKSDFVLLVRLETGDFFDTAGTNGHVYRSASLIFAHD